MFAAKKGLHQLAMGITRVASKLLPDRVPVTFVGPDSSRELCEAIGQTGATKVFIVTDEVLVRLGMIEEIARHLEDASVQCAIYDGVEPDPTFAQIEAGFERLKQEGCDAVLAVGGGSPMDASKLIAALASNPGPLAKLEGPLKIRRTPMPLFAIPTTAGTGSEATVAAVASDTETHEKKFFVDPKLLPLMTALDPKLMLGLPQNMTAATGMDALTHAVESFLSRMPSAQAEIYARIAIKLIFENLPRVYAQGDDLAGRKAMALASYYAGLAFTRTSVGYVHAIAHTFGAYYRTPHGLANAIALPHVLDFYQDVSSSRLAEMAELIGLPGNSEADKAQNFIDAVRALMAKVDIPYTLDALDRGDIVRIAKQALAEAHLNYPVPRYMSEGECEALLEKIVSKPVE